MQEKSSEGLDKGMAKGASAMKNATAPTKRASIRPAPDPHPKTDRKAMVKPMRSLAFMMADFTEVLSELSPDGLELLGEIIYGIKDTLNPAAADVTAADVRRTVKEVLGEPTEAAREVAFETPSEEDFPWADVHLPEAGTLLLSSETGESLQEIDLTSGEYYSLKQHLVGLRGYPTRQRAEWDKLMRGEVPEGYGDGDDAPEFAADHLKTARDFYRAFPSLVVCEKPPAGFAELLAKLS